jgi:large subunit ribosomal protein LP1
MSNAELATGYAALILADEGIEVTADKLTTLTKAAGVEVESIWTQLFAKALEGKDVKDMLLNVGGTPPFTQWELTVGSGGAAPAAGGASAAAGGAAEEAPKEEEKEEAAEESDEDVRFYYGLTDFRWDSVCLIRVVFWVDCGWRIVCNYSTN